MWRRALRDVVRSVAGWEEGCSGQAPVHRRPVLFQSGREGSSGVSMETRPRTQYHPEPQYTMVNSGASLSVTQPDVRDKADSYKTTEKPIRQHSMLVLHREAPTGLCGPEGQLGLECSQKSSRRS